MLSNPFITFSLIRGTKVGLYIDFLVKTKTQNFIENWFIWGGVYVSEKLIIEYITRFTVNSYVTFRLPSKPIQAWSNFSLQLSVIIILIWM